MENSITEKIWTKIVKHKDIISIILILLLAALFRYSGYNWDDGHNFHPDERAIGYAVSELDFYKGLFDPKLYAYGSLPVYLIKIIGMVLSALSPTGQSYDSYILIGRFLSATASIFTIFLVYLIGRKLYNNIVGIFSSLFLALTVSNIQDSHFATVDAILAFFVVLTIYLLIDIFYSKRSFLWYYLVSISIGLALAVKISALPLIGVFFICHIINLYRQKKLYDLNAWLIFVSCGIVIIFVNFLAQPYAYIHYSEFLSRVQSELRIARTGDICYDQQYIGTPFLMYYIKEILFRSMGPPLGLLSLISFAIAAVVTILNAKNSKHLLILLWALPYFITLNTYVVKYIRYLEPLFPFLCLFAGYYFVTLMRYLSTTKTKKFIAGLISTVIIGYTLFYALAFFSIYMRPHTFVVGSKWFYTNVPNNAFILSQHWDEGFPLGLNSLKHKTYEEGKDKKDLELYEHFGSKTENRVKAEHIARYLEKGDYIVAQTRRLYGALATVKEQYPISIRYFDLLFTNQLGYKLIKEFNSYPTLLGIEINDDLSDESFSVYDHPKILIFKKVTKLTKDEYINKLESKKPLTLSKNKMLNIHHSEPNKITAFTIVDEILIVIIWLILLELLSIIGTAINHLIIKKSDASGVFYTHLIGLLVFAYIIWLLASLNFISYSFPFILAVFLILLSVSITYIYNNRNTLKEYIVRNLDTISFSQLIFISCFFIYLVIRSQSPEIYWGEKPMDFGILNNLIQINHLPPDEIWFGGNTLNYYYFGHFIFATLAKLTFIPSYFVYNLAIATIASLTISASCGILYLLTRSYFYSTLAAIFTVFWANLSGIRELIYGAKQIDFDFYWATTRVIPSTINEYPLWSLIFADLHAHVYVMAIFIYLIYLGVYIYKNIVNKEPIPWLVYIMASFILGVISLTNTWDVPGACIVLFVCITTALYSTINLADFKSNLTKIVKHYFILILIVLSNFLWFIPYWLYTKSTTVLSIGRVLKNEYVCINDYLFVWGFFLFVFTSLFLIEIHQAIKKTLLKKRSHQDSNTISWLFTVLIIILLLISLQYITILFTTAILILGIVTFILLKEPIIRLICALIVLGIGMTLFAQVFFIYDHMNTIFKFFLETWYLFAICTPYVFYYIFKPYYPAFRRTDSIYIELLRVTWVIVLSILVFLSLFTVFTAIAGFTKTHTVKAYKPTHTINGLSYLQYQDPEEYDAINWIKKNIKEPGIMLEAQRKDESAYGSYTRIVMNTGIPTVVGWEHHLTQRAISRNEIKQRYEDIKTIYSTKDISIAYNLLNKYQVKYIYIGNLEAETYGTIGFKKFETSPAMFKLIYSNPDIKIYAVL